MVGLLVLWSDGIGVEGVLVKSDRSTILDEVGFPGQKSRRCIGVVGSDRIGDGGDVSIESSVVQGRKLEIPRGKVCRLLERHTTDEGCGVPQ